jgi:hypothetical protein
MSPFLGLSLHEKRKGLCLIRTFGPSSRIAQVQAAEARVGHQSPVAIVFASAFLFFRGASAL